MAVDKPKLDPRLLELLYPDEAGELDEAELQALLDEAALSADDARDLGDLKSMLGLIRAEEISEDVPASVHSSIMDAARAYHAPDAGAPTTSRVDEAAGRVPRVPEAERLSPKDGAAPLWARIRINTRRQIALVATVLFVAGAAFLLMRDPQPESRYAVPTSASTSSAASEESIAKSPASKDQETEPQKSEIAQADSLQNSIETDESAAEALGRGEAELALKADSDSEAKPDGPSAPNYGGRRSRPAPLRKRAIPSSKRGLSARAKKSKSAPSKDLFPTLESKAEVEEEVASDTSKIDAIAESFASAHYDETTTRVDAFMRDPDASAQDKPRALEFKARAQEAGGDPSAALDTYERILREYSTFNPSAIRAAITRLDAQLNPSPMRQKHTNEAPPPRPASMDIDSAQ